MTAYTTLLQQILVNCREAVEHHDSTLTPALTGLVGTIIGAATSFGGVLFVQRRGSRAWRRWVEQSHFEIFQDVADCAGEYAEFDNFGPFGPRLRDRLKSLSDSLHQDASVGLSEKAYRSIYRSISSADYMLWMANESFDAKYQVPYINKCLADMKDAQLRFGKLPKMRPFTEEGLIEGSHVLSLSTEGEINITRRENANQGSI